VVATDLRQFGPFFVPLTVGDLLTVTNISGGSLTVGGAAALRATRIGA
jgi:hypothetical protein